MFYICKKNKNMNDKFQNFLTYVGSIGLVSGLVYGIVVLINMFL